MLIVCPSCQAEYNVPDALLGRAARQVRCARCANEWLPDELRPPVDEAPAPTPAPAPPPAPAHAPPAVLREADEATTGEPVTAPSLADEFRLPTTTGTGHAARSALGPAVGWLASLALLGAAGWAAATWREAVVQAWPASQRLYEWVGLS